MTTDDELRKLIPALPEPLCVVNSATPQWAWDGYSEDQMEAHALATTRAVWAAAIERDTLDAQRYRWLQAEHERIDPQAAVVWKYRMDRTCSDWVNTASPKSLDDNIDAAIRSIGSGEQT